MNYFTKITFVAGLLVAQSPGLTHAQDTSNPDYMKINGQTTTVVTDSVVTTVPAVTAPANSVANYTNNAFFEKLMKGDAAAIKTAQDMKLADDAGWTAAYSNYNANVSKYNVDLSNTPGKVNCPDALRAGNGACLSANYMTPALQTAQQLNQMKGVSNANSIANSQLSSFSGNNTNTNQVQIDAAHNMALNAQAGVNREMAMSAMGASVASANMTYSLRARQIMNLADKDPAAAAKALGNDNQFKTAYNDAANAYIATHDGVQNMNRDDFAQTPEGKKFIMGYAGQAMQTSSTAAAMALAPTMTLATQAIMDQQQANALKSQADLIKKELQNTTGNNVVQYAPPDTPVINPDPSPTPTIGSDNSGGFSPGYGQGGAAGGNAAGQLAAGPGASWSPNAAGGGSAGAGGGLGGGSGGGGSGSPAHPGLPLIDPNTGKPFYANVNEGAAGYNAGRGPDGNPLPFNTNLAQYLPKDGGVNDVVGGNGKKDEAGVRGIASVEDGILGPEGDIFARVPKAIALQMKKGSL